MMYLLNDYLFSIARGIFLGRTNVTFVQNKARTLYNATKFW